MRPPQRTLPTLWHSVGERRHCMAPNLARLHTCKRTRTPQPPSHTPKPDDHIHSLAQRAPQSTAQPEHVLASSRIVPLPPLPE